MVKNTGSMEPDYKNRFNRQLWLEDRRRDLYHYYDSRNMNNGRIGQEPYWSVVPRTSIWQIPSLGTPGFDGWFGIAGDHPTDVVPLNYFNGEPRIILQHFVNKWLRAAERLKAGEDFFGSLVVGCKVGRGARAGQGQGLGHESFARRIPVNGQRDWGGKKLR